MKPFGDVESVRAKQREVSTSNVFAVLWTPDGSPAYVAMGDVIAHGNGTRDRVAYGASGSCWYGEIAETVGSLSR